MSGGPQYALRFISGKYQGGEFPLKMDKEIIIGRSSDLEMVLVEDMVSRKHAKISTPGGQVIIQDLGSTNGTFVNGEKIKKVRLREGDRILIGTSIIKLVTTEAGAAGASGPPLPSGINLPPTVTAVNPRHTSGNVRASMSGTIDEIPLPDLLQLLSTSKKSGVLEIQSNQNTGKVYLRKGQVYWATINDQEGVDPLKTIYRIILWTTGTFDLLPPDDKTFPKELNEPVEALLMEAMRQCDEIKRMEKDLPEPTDIILLVEPLTAKLRDLKPEQLDLLQSIINHKKMQAIIDDFQQDDLQSAEQVMQLIKAGYVRVKKD